MDKNTEVLETHEAPEGETPEVNEEQVTLTKAELEDLKHRADISSQNFERAKKAEAKVKEYETIEVPTLELDNDEDISQLKNRLSEMEKRFAKSEITEAYPALKEIWDEFETFYQNPENVSMPMKTAARVFLSEKGISEKRKGLEKATGGRAPISTGMTTDDVKRLRETNYKEYMQKLKRGQLKFS